MKIKVMSRKQAEEYLSGRHDRTSIMISICDTDENDLIFNAELPHKVKAVKSVHFDDVNFGEGVISFQQALEIAGFVRSHIYDVELIIVHCSAGISRSAGCAAAIMKYYSGSDEQIFNDPSYDPNRTVYCRVLEAFRQTRNC